MSYGINLVRLPIGTDPQTIASASEAMDEETELNPGQPDPASEEWKRQLVRTLQAINPLLEAFPFDFDELARTEHITEDEARRRFRHVELNGSDQSTGIQITLFDSTATLTVPFWHHGEAAQRVWREIWSYLAVLAREGGLQAYDPQLERVLTLSTDFDAVIKRYDHGVVATDEVAAGMSESPPAPRPWWKFW